MSEEFARKVEFERLKRYCVSNWLFSGNTSIRAGFKYGSIGMLY
jgi:hypothetical protein